MKSTQPWDEMINNYVRWQKDIIRYVDDVNSWEQEIIRMRKSLDFIRVAIGKHGNLLRKHKELLHSNSRTIKKKQDKVNLFDPDYVDKLSIAHQKEIEQVNFQSLAHENIRKSHRKFIIALNKMLKDLE